MNTRRAMQRSACMARVCVHIRIYYTLVEGRSQSHRLSMFRAREWVALLMGEAPAHGVKQSDRTRPTIGLPPRINVWSCEADALTAGLDRQR